MVVGLMLEMRLAHSCQVLRYFMFVEVHIVWWLLWPTNYSALHHKRLKLDHPHYLEFGFKLIAIVIQSLQTSNRTILVTCVPSVILSNIEHQNQFRWLQSCILLVLLCDTVEYAFLETWNWLFISQEVSVLLLNWIQLGLQVCDLFHVSICLIRDPTQA